MRTIFLADAHLLNSDDRNYRMLCQFLRELTGTTEALFIMGDLFDFWVGFPSPSFIAPHRPILQALDDLVRHGCRLVYFEGNHDFHLGDIFRHQLGTEIHTEAEVITVQGRKLFLCHGDQINRADYGYRFLRMLLHNRLVRQLVNIFPPALALRLRDRLQQSSRAGYEAKTARWDYAEIIRAKGRILQQQGIDGIVTGHFHLPLCEQLDASAFMILSLGDWMKQLTYGEMIDGQLVLKRYQAPDLTG